MSKNITFRATPAERALWQEAADACGETLSEWAREMLTACALDGGGSCTLTPRARQRIAKAVRERISAFIRDEMEIE